MNSQFSNKLLSLRKARGISQKEVANNLGISQALLSHYEKGIRECGLDFVVRASKYFKVSCDYILCSDSQLETSDALMPEISSLNYLISQIYQRGEKHRRICESLISLFIYSYTRDAMLLCDEKDSNIFEIDRALYSGLCNGLSSLYRAKTIELSKKHLQKSSPDITEKSISSDSLNAELASIIQKAESLLKTAL